MAAHQCNGKGHCLMLSDSLDDYEKDDDYECEYNCQLINCPNYVICHKSLPQWVFDTSNGLCVNCDIIFGQWQGGKGILELKDVSECCVCLETKQSVELPKCDHTMCVDCIRRCYFGKDIVECDSEDEMEQELELQYLSKCPLCRK